MKKTKTIAFSNLIGAIVFIVLGIWAWIQTTSFQEVNNTAVQPSAFPQIMIVGMEIFSIVLLIQSIIRLAGTMKEDDPLAEPAASIDFIHDKGVRYGLITVLLCVFYVAMFETLGYVIVSAIVGIVIMFLIGKRNWLQMLLVGILVPLGMWLVFYKVLTVNIPMGPLQILRDLVDKI